MDNSPGARVRQTAGVPVNSSREWSTPIGLVVCGWLLTAAAAWWCWLTESATDRLFVAVLALVLATASAYVSLARPRLRADESGITLRGLGRTRHHPWSRIQVHVRSRQRLGRSARTLELDGDNGELVVLGRIDLGEDPEDVAEAIEGLRR